MPAQFSPVLYLAANPDVRAAGIDPVVHYLEFSAREGRKLRPEGSQNHVKETIKGAIRGLRGKLRLGNVP